MSEGPEVRVPALDCTNYIYEVVLEAMDRVAERWATEGLPDHFFERHTFWVDPGGWFSGEEESDG